MKEVVGVNYHKELSKIQKEIDELIKQIMSHEGNLTIHDTYSEWEIAITTDLMTCGTGEYGSLKLYL